MSSPSSQRRLVLLQVFLPRSLKHSRTLREYGSSRMSSLPSHKPAAREEGGAAASREAAVAACRRDEDGRTMSLVTAAETPRGDMRTTVTFTRVDDAR